VPRIEIDQPRVERLGARTFRVSARLRNTGGLPTRTAMGVKTRRLHHTLVSLDVDREQVLGGDAVVNIDRIAPDGGVFETTWLVRGTPGARTAVVVDSPELGTQRLDFRLTATDGEEQQ